MLRALYTAATGMDAQQLRMDTIANNLANTSTTGFKKVRAEFEDLLSETIRPAAEPAPQGGSSPSPMQVGLGVKAGSITRTFTQGDLTTTNSQYDLAIEGVGFFKVLRPDGNAGYTRAGNFRVDAVGRLVTQRGEVVEPEVTVPFDTTSLTVKPDGTILATLASRDVPEELGKLQIHAFPNPGGLEAAGGNIYLATPGSGEPQVFRPGESGAGTIAQGVLEGSNVKAVEEMINMIAVQRAYELNSKVISTVDQMLQKLGSLR